MELDVEEGLVEESSWARRWIMRLCEVVNVARKVVAKGVEGDLVWDMVCAVCGDGCVRTEYWTV